MDDVLPMTLVLVGTVFAVEAFQRLRHAWYERGLRRRFEQGDVMVEEYREYLAAMGEEPKPVEPLKLVGGVAQMVFFLSVPAVILTYDLPDWSEFALMAAYALAGGSLWLWHYLNDPPADESHGPYADDRSITVPPEALSWLAAAMVVLLLFVLFITFIV